MHGCVPDNEPARLAAVSVALRRLGLIGAEVEPRFQRLTGGVSSDIWRVELPDGPVCVKMALDRLRVTQDWRAPLERNAYEVEWMRVAGTEVPDAVPEILAEDREANFFVMGYLPPRRYPVWKDQLRDGVVETATARAVADRLLRIHGATANDPVIERRFQTDEIFHAIRLAPYFEAAAEAQPNLADALLALVRTTKNQKIALVHGDVSPKNILIGPNGPVFLDAECAWYGDPAFDLAFCLNHLLLKCLWRPGLITGFMDCFDAMAERYVHGVDWEQPGELEARTARLLPALLLARVDGKSPVEYVTADQDKDHVRRFAAMHVLEPVAALAELSRNWLLELRRPS